MLSSNLQQILVQIDSFEKYEQFKSDHVDKLRELAWEIIKRHSLPEGSLELCSEGTNIVFSLNQQVIIKIYPPFHSDQFENEFLTMQHLAGKLSIKTPIPKHQGEIMNWPYQVMTQLQGELLEHLWETLEHSNKLIIIHELGALIKEVHALPTLGLESIDCDWERFIEQQLHHCLEQQQTTQLPQPLLEQIDDYLQPIKQSLKNIDKPVILTGEYTPMNILVKSIKGIWHIHGLIDFGDAMLGLPEYDLLGPGAFLIQGDKQLLSEFLTAYGYSKKQMNAKLSHQLMALMLLHKYSNLNVQMRIPDWQNKVSSLQDLEKLIWGF